MKFSVTESSTRQPPTAIPGTILSATSTASDISCVTCRRALMLARSSLLSFWKETTLSTPLMRPVFALTLFYQISASLTVLTR